MRIVSKTITVVGALKSPRFKFEIVLQFFVSVFGPFFVSQVLNVLTGVRLDFFHTTDLSMISPQESS